MDLIDEGKFTKYLFYAVGEICLLVIGILIALQFNNNNQERQNRQIELQYYQTMKAQFEKDKVMLEEEIQDARERKEAHLVGSQIIQSNDHMRIDELGKYVLRLINYGDFRRKSSVLYVVKTFWTKSLHI